MSQLKDVTIEAIRKLPDECSAEDVMYEINFVAQVMEGLKDAESGRLLTTSQPGRAMGKVECTEKASANLLAIHEYISKDSKVYATRFVKSLVTATSKL